MSGRDRRPGRVLRSLALRPMSRALRSLLALLAASAVGASAQPAPCPDAAPACASLRAFLDDAPTDGGPAADTSAAVARAAALRLSDPVFGGERTALPAEGVAVAYEWTLGADRRVVAANPGAAPAFVPLGGDGVPAPLVPVFVSRADAGPVPALVAVLDDDRVVYGLRVPPHATVAYRPAAPAEVRPRGLDE